MPSVENELLYKIIIITKPIRSCELGDEAVLLRHSGGVTRDEGSSEVVKTIFSVTVPLREHREQKEMQAVSTEAVFFFGLSRTDIQSSSLQGNVTQSSLRSIGKLSLKVRTGWLY